MGTLCYHAGYNDVAIELIRRAVAIDPAVSAYHSNLGNLLRVTGNVDEAIAAYQAACLAAASDMGEIYSNLASAALVEKGATGGSDSLPIIERLNSVRNWSRLIAILGMCLPIKAGWRRRLLRTEARSRSGRITRKCIANLGMCVLLQGEYASGWREYEWRWKCGDASDPRGRFSQPLWDGGDLAGRTILLHAEQGFGDTIQFIRYARLVANRGGKVIVECQRELIGLLSQLSYVSAWVAYGESLPAFDVHYPLLSLPLVFGTTLENIPSYGKPLRTPADRVKLRAAARRG